jgi:hypothetical protein
VQNTAEVVWRACANLDPKRDLSFVEGPIDQLDHGASQALFGGKVCIDATRKWPEEGYRREWPEVCRFPREVSDRAEAVLEELGVAPRPDGWRASGGGNGPAPAGGPRLRDVLERLARAAEKSG